MKKLSCLSMALASGLVLAGSIGTALADIVIAVPL